MILLSHPTGSQFVRQALLAFEERGLLSGFNTTVSWNSNWKLNSLLPQNVRAELNRRSYPQIPAGKIKVRPLREAGRLLYPKLGLDSRPKCISIFSVYDSLDKFTAKTLSRSKPTAVYAYEGGALRTFQEAKRNGIKCVYELPSGYWYHELNLLREEAELRPDYASTIQKLVDPPGHNEKKDQELTLADRIVIPSHHVLRTLFRTAFPPSKFTVVPYGANQSNAPVRRPISDDRKLRVLFVGALTQRKGIGYVLDAIEALGDRIEFSMIGKRIADCAPIDQALTKYRWTPSAPHETILSEMAAHDVLVLPSLSEGFALVISEALSRGLPVITTRNSGGEEMIEDGIHGFFVELRSSAQIIQKIQLLDRNRERLEFMSRAAVDRSSELSWTRYRDMLVSALQPLLIQ